MLRHTFVTAMLDAGVGLRDVQIATRHADPRATTRYDRARGNLDRPPQLHPRRLHGRRHLTDPGSSPRGRYPPLPMSVPLIWAMPDDLDVQKAGV
jgi:hypothetical protein